MYLRPVQTLRFFHKIWDSGANFIMLRYVQIGLRKGQADRSAAFPSGSVLFINRIILF